MLTFIQALLKAYSQPFKRSEADILEKLRIHYESSPRMSESEFGIVINCDALIKYAKARKDLCPWIQDLSLDFKNTECPVFWITENCKINNFRLESICCSNNIVIVLDNNRLFEFFKLARDISYVLGIDIPPDGGYEYNIGESSFVFNICFAEKICQCN